MKNFVLEMCQILVSWSLNSEVIKKSHRTVDHKLNFSNGISNQRDAGIPPKATNLIKSDDKHFHDSTEDHPGDLAVVEIKIEKPAEATILSKVSSS